MAELAATHVHCIECDAYTEIEPDRTAEDTCCDDCNDDDRDAWIVEPVAVFPCPHGVTRADWMAHTDQGCDDENHEFKSGNHVVEVR